MNNGDLNKSNQKADIFLNIGDHCDLKCIFCSRSLPEHNKNNRRSTAFKIEKLELRLSYFYNKFKVKRLNIGGTEPLNNFDIVKILEVAKKIGFEDILLMTTGIKLADKQLIDVLIKSGVVEFELPIYGHNSRVHDSITGVKGSFNRLLEGLEKLKRYPGIKILMHTLLLKQNCHLINKMNDFVMNVLGVHDFKYLQVMPRNNNPSDYRSHCPSFTKIKHLLKTVKPINSINLYIPLCILPDSHLKELLMKDIAKYYNSPHIDKVIITISPQEISFIKKTERENIIKPPKCKWCRLRNLCRGVYKAYFELYGDKELAPFK